MFVYTPKSITRTVQVQYSGIQAVYLKKMFHNKKLPHRESVLLTKISREFDPKCLNRIFGFGIFKQCKVVSWVFGEQWNLRPKVEGMILLTVS